MKINFKERKNFLKRYLPYVTQIKELGRKLYSLDLKFGQLEEFKYQVC